MKKFIKTSVIGLAATLALLGGCTKNFDDLNTDNSKLAKMNNVSLDFLFSTAQNRGIFSGNNAQGTFQLFEALFSDLQAQYFATTKTSFPSDRNVMQDNWLGPSWTYFYGNAYPQMDEVLKLTKEGELADPIKNAMAKVWKVFMFMPVTDYWGAVPYTDAGSGKNVILYDKQEFIYKDFLKLLNEASAVLGTYNGTGKFFEKGDLIYGGDVKKWAKFCNSLHLRVAMRISKVDPNLAKTEAEAAIAAPGGLLTLAADNAFMKVTTVTLNPLSHISSFGEFRMSAAMESVLKGYNDPRLQKFFDPVGTTTTYKGVRNGLSADQITLPVNSAANNSNINSSFGVANKFIAPFPLFNAAETWFLMAEAKLNGWNTGAGTAKEYYENGISASMERWGVTDANAIANYKVGTSTPAPLGDMFNTPAMSNIPVVFGASEAVQREQIGTQKWLGLYPYSPEAWSEFRRTGFPKLYPRVNSDNADAPANDPASVRRTPYPGIETSTNPKGLASGIANLGGPDKVSTRLWWNP